MKPTHRAIVFLQQARDIIEDEAMHHAVENTNRIEALREYADAIGDVLVALEMLDGTP
jgi:hypothetical protein